MKRHIITALICACSLFAVSCGKAADTPAAGTAASDTIATDTSAEDISDGLPVIEVTSADLHGGVWDSVITNTKNGSNVSPQLSWAPVEGADGYIVYMTDTSAGNWLHWKSGVITQTELEQGAAGKKEYVGPYPPSGTHTYEIYVYAVDGTVEKVPGIFDSSNRNFDSFREKINEEAAILACGHICGTYTKGD